MAWEGGANSIIEQPRPFSRVLVVEDLQVSATLLSTAVETKGHHTRPGKVKWAVDGLLEQTQTLTDRVVAALAMLALERIDADPRQDL